MCEFCVGFEEGVEEGGCGGGGYGGRGYGDREHGERANKKMVRERIRGFRGGRVRIWGLDDKEGGLSCHTGLLVAGLREVMTVLGWELLGVD